jgi:sensor c-di-GMP phosphodiesterase-like protein
VAEGIETQAQLDFLRHHGCRYGQGFLFSRPVGLDRFVTLLRDAPAAD